MEWYIAVVVLKPKYCTLWIRYISLRISSSLFHLCLKRFTKSQERIGRKCTRFSIWGTEWNYTYQKKSRKTLLKFQNHLMSMHKLLVVSKKVKQKNLRLYRNSVLLNIKHIYGQYIIKQIRSYSLPL